MMDKATKTSEIVEEIDGALRPESREAFMKKPFAKPELRCHEDLPKVTTGFTGSFNP